MVPCVKDSNPLGTQKISMKSRLVHNWSHFTRGLIVAAVTWLKYCRCGVKLYPINQSVYQRRHFGAVLMHIIELAIHLHYTLQECSIVAMSITVGRSSNVYCKHQQNLLLIESYDRLNMKGCRDFSNCLKDVQSWVLCTFMDLSSASYFISSG